jgi:hypothetical protein
MLVAIATGKVATIKELFAVYTYTWEWPTYCVVPLKGDGYKNPSTLLKVNYHETITQTHFLHL